MQKVNKNKVEKEYQDNMGFYWLGDTHSAVPLIEAIADNYKIKHLKKMIALDFNELKSKAKTIPDDLVVLVKRDGEYNLFYFDLDIPKSIFCNSPNARARHDLPVNHELEGIMQLFGTISSTYSIAGAIEKLPNENKAEMNLLGQENLTKIKYSPVYQMILAGELFATVTRENDRPRVFDFLTISRNPGSYTDLERIHYDIFDIISINQVDLLKISYKTRILLCKNIFELKNYGKKYCNVIEFESGVPASRLEGLYEKWVNEQRNEGLVIHTKYNLIYKVKPAIDIDCVIIGYSEMLNEKKIRGLNSISNLLVALMRPDGSYQQLAKVGGGFSEIQRIAFYNLLSPMRTISDLFARESDGRAYVFVEPRYIITVTFTDVISESSKGESVYQPALTFDSAEKKCKLIKAMPFVSLISPRFAKVRSEIDPKLLGSFPDEQAALPLLDSPKQVVYHDLRLEQISERVSIDASKAEMETKIISLPKSNLVLKLIFGGEWSKGLKYARKMLIWATNKHGLDPSYASHIFYYSNYALRRSEPYQVMAVPCGSIAIALKTLNQVFLEELTSETTDKTTQKKKVDFKKTVDFKKEKTFMDATAKQEAANVLDPIVKQLMGI